MSSLLNRLQYMTQSGLSLNKIAIETEVPYSTLWYYANGQRNLPEKYENALYNMYTRTAYANLKEAGLNASQANIFRWYTPEYVLKIEVQVQTALLEYAKYGLARKAMEEGVIATEEWIAANIEDYMTKIKKSFATSNITKDEYIKYIDKIVPTE